MTTEILVGGALLLLALSRLRGGGGGQRVIAAVRTAFGETVPQPVAAAIEKHAAMHGVPLSVATALCRESKWNARAFVSDPTNYALQVETRGREFLAMNISEAAWGRYGITGLLPTTAVGQGLAIAMGGWQQTVAPLFIPDTSAHLGIGLLGKLGKRDDIQGDWQRALRWYAGPRNYPDGGGGWAAKVMADAGALRLAGIDEVPRA